MGDERAARFVEAARRYAELGWATVRADGKTPKGQGWQHAAPDPDPEHAAGAWSSWGERWNLGLVLGSSGLAVVEFDTEQAGERLLELLGGELPATPTVQSGSGRLHLYFRDSGHEHATRDGLELRTGAHFMVAPPSTHPDTGRPYEWLIEPWRAGVELADVPQAVLDYFVETVSPNGRAEPVAEIIPEGQRRDRLLSLAGLLRRKGLGADEIYATLAAVSSQRCRPPLDERELRELADDVPRRYEPAERLGTPAYTGPSSELEETLAVFRKWLDLPDLEPVLATLGAASANLLDGSPVWLVLVGAPSSGKTETLGSLSLLPDVYPVGTLTEASLLSGTPRRERASAAKGGLLREIGEFGVVICKDFGSVLSMNRDGRASTLAALREIFDGSWTRYVGVDGGKALHWSGKLGLLAGATPVLDRHHAVLASLGDRFVLCRLPEPTDKQAERALEYVGEQETIMRRELAEAVAALFAGRRNEPQPLADHERRSLIDVAGLVTRARSAIERDRFTREIELVPGAEGPARLVRTLERLLAGLDSLGCDRQLALQVVRRVALDCIPMLRRRALERLADSPAPETTKTVAETLDLPTNTVRRVLEDLTAYGLVARYGKGEGNADTWTLDDRARSRLAPS